MNTIKGESILTLIINKSTFISHIFHVETTIEAKEYINKIKAMYPDATHHVSAYIVGSNGEFGHYNDDKEPSGTAGLPVFECLRKNNLTNVVCVIVRYFGGIKLGAGGLIRAYSKSASENLKQISIIPLTEMINVEIIFDYNYLREVENFLTRYDIIERLFTTNVFLKVNIPLNDKEDFKSKLNELTLGSVIINER